MKCELIKYIKKCLGGCVQSYYVCSAKFEYKNFYKNISTLTSEITIISIFLNIILQKVILILKRKEYFHMIYYKNCLKILFDVIFFSKQSVFYDSKCNLATVPCLRLIQFYKLSRLTVKVFKKLLFTVNFYLYKAFLILRVFSHIRYYILKECALFFEKSVSEKKNYLFSHIKFIIQRIYYIKLENVTFCGSSNAFTVSFWIFFKNYTIRKVFDL